MAKQESVFLLILCLLVLVGFTACQQSTAENDRVSMSVKAPHFSPNPQPVEKQEVKTLAVGAKAPNFKLPGTDGQYHELSDFAAAKALAIIFTCNHCPTAQAYEGRIKTIDNDYKDKGLQIVAISPNSPLGLLYEELGYSDLNDDFEEMIIRDKDQSFDFPYLYDGDDQKISLSYGPVATPHVFLFDADRTLAYVGRIDKVEKPGNLNGEDLRTAIDAVLAGKSVPEPTTKTFGCSTKWGWKLATKKKIDAEWKEKEVVLNPLDEKGVQALLKNEDSQKLRLIKIWATWCGPCILEYPEYVKLQRMFGARDFEFVSLSADKPSANEKVLKVLKEKHSALTNYYFSDADKYALIEAVDPEWNGALPYTILVEPGGNIVWSHQGDVDFYALKKLIVDHEMIGRYF